ncbi:hypothetical protein REPUB_Repub17cG0039400 [Reevesia pubescens]
MSKREVNKKVLKVPGIEQKMRISFRKFTVHLRAVVPEQMIILRMKGFDSGSFLNKISVVLLVMKKHCSQAFSPHASNNSHRATSDFGNSPFPPNQKVEVLDEFDPRGSVSGAPSTAPTTAVPIASTNAK